MHYIRISSN